VRTILLERSLLDIFRDLVYFPYVTRIIGFFVTVATVKPDPGMLPELLKELPKEVADVSNRKGLLSLTPAAVEELILPLNGRDMLPVNYGQTDEEWYRHDEYKDVEAPPHELTFERRMVLFLDSRMGWPSVALLLGVTLAGAYSMRVQKVRKMMIQNSTFCCLLLTVLAVAVKVKRYQNIKKRNWKKPPQVAVLKNE
jgi:hypothetical protein